MTMMNIIMDGEGAWPDLKEKPVAQLHHVKGVAACALLHGGMQSGQPSVALRIELPDGSTVVAETSARLFVTAGRCFAARYPELFNDAPSVN